MVFKQTAWLGCMLLLLQCGGNDAQKGGEAALDATRQIKILFQNDYVLVTKLMLEPGEALAIHRQNNRILLAERDCNLEVVEGDKKPVTRHFDQNEFAWYDAMIHSIRNPGDSTVVVYAITRKQTPLPENVQADITSPKKANKRERFANKTVRVYEVFLAAGKKGASFSHRYRLAYALDEFEMRQIYADGTDETILYRPGIFVWSDPQTAQLENIGATDARYLLFEFLQ